MSWRNKGQAKRWYNRYSDREKDKKRKAYEADPNRKKELVHINRARKLGLLGKISPGIIQTLYDKQNGRCAYDIHWCNNKLGDSFHVDHILPLYLGGIHEDSNLQLLCKTCSKAKWKKHPDEFFRDYVKFLRKEL